jgi:phosphoribosylamine--glycine ligase
MGDPETESVIPRIQNDLVRLFNAVANQSLEKEIISVSPLTTATVMLVAEGYPNAYEKGMVITGQEQVDGSLVFHAGTKLNTVTGETVANGGRVMAVTSFGKTMHEALAKSYENAAKIDFKGKHYRKDIGFDL